MKTTWRLTRNVFLLGMILLATSDNLHAQNVNPRASQWFKTGLSESDPEKKAEAYLKAIELEPLFVEALYNLGLVYIQLKDYQAAQQYLNKALIAKPNNQNRKLTTQILLTLASVNKRLDNLTESEQNLLEARSLADDKSTLSKISFELGRLLHEQKRYDAALAELKRGQSIDPEADSYFVNLIGLIEQEREMEGLYAAAETAYQRGDFDRASQLYEQIHARNPEYRDVGVRIASIDSMEKTQARQQVLENLYAEAVTLDEQKQLEKALAAYHKLLNQAQDYKDVEERILVTSKKLEEKKAREQLEAEYSKGLQALTERNWTAAILAFERVLALSPNYRDADTRLEEANRGLENAGTETIVSLYYSQAIEALDKNELGSALAALEKVRLINPNYKETSKLIARIEQRLQSKLDASSPANAYFDILYKEAMAAMEKEQWMQAVLNLEKLRMLKPNDEEILNLLSHARANSKIASSPAANATNGHKVNTLIYAGWALAAAIGLPIFGFLIFSPTARARFYFMRGKYLKAAQIYERLLLRHPDKVKLYVLLAKIYLMTGRNDEHATRIFQMLINLNLATHMHPQIKTVLTEKYLTGKTTEPDAISVLENALKNEREKKNES